MYISNYFITLDTSHYSKHNFVIPKCEHFINFELFSSPRGWKLDEKNFFKKY